MITPFPVDPDRIAGAGGVAGVAVYLSRQLFEREGVELEVLSPQFNERVSRTVNFHGIPVRYLANPGGRLTHRWFVHQAPRRVAEIANQSDFDLVHVQGITRWTQFVTKPYVFTVHGIPEQNFVYREFSQLRRLVYPLVRAGQQRLRRRIPNVISISPYVRQALDGSLQGHVWEIENPVRDDFFEVRRAPVAGQLLFGGKICEEKNVASLILAVSQLRAQSYDVRLRIAGLPQSNHYYKKCRRLVKERGLTGVVEFAGGLTIDQMQHELARATALVLCSWQETAPLIIEEAMAAGVPVVASNRCGMPFMIEDGKTGKLVEPDNVESIAKGIVGVLDPQVNEAMSRRAKSAAELRFKASVVAKKTAQVYRDILVP